jgi:hypothetical protein
MDRKFSRIRVLLTLSLLATMWSLIGVGRASAEQNIDVSVSIADGLLPDDVSWGSTAQEGLSGGPTCSYSGVPRYTSPPTVAAKSVVYVYLVPSDGNDYHYDQPKFCTDGRILASPIHNLYADGALFMSREEYTNHGASRRYNPLLKTYVNGTSTSNVVFGGFVRDTAHNTATWNCWGGPTKLANVKSVLRAQGWTNTNAIYVAIIEAKQDCASLPQNQSVAGEAYINSALSAGCTDSCFAYSLRIFYDRSTSTWYVPKYGCGNYPGDAVNLHEVTHILGAVPANGTLPDGTLNSDGTGHITSSNDLMDATLPNTFTNSGGTTDIMDMDCCHSDYRLTIDNRGWTVAGYDPNNTYRTC